MNLYINIKHTGSRISKATNLKVENRQHTSDQCQTQLKGSIVLQEVDRQPKRHQFHPVLYCPASLCNNLKTWKDIILYIPNFMKRNAIIARLLKSKMHTRIIHS